MAKFKKIIVAGPLVVECVYPAPNPRDSVGVRAGKKEMSSEAQRRMNLKYAYQKLELLIAANFGVRDLYVTLTYDDAHLPRNRAESRKIMQAFWKRLRKARKEKDQELRYLYVTEHKHGDGRWHHHALINATGEDYSLIRQLWGQGGVEFKQLRIDRDKNFETLARYLCKEQRDKVGLRLWSGSRNLRKPERECSVGLAIGKAVCSVCGADQTEAVCQHRGGREYDGKLCWFDLSDVEDAYEVSLCAVPSQPEAGVVKSKRYGGQEKQVPNPAEAGHEEALRMAQAIQAQEEKRYGGIEV